VLKFIRYFKVQIITFVLFKHLWKPSIWS